VRTRIRQICVAKCTLPPMNPLGKIYLVGAGPGDPGLITARGIECLAMADAVLYDALVNPVLLRHAPHAEAIFAGKKSGGHSLPQGDINALLIAQARLGRRVVRLKGGDPFVFGRGGEEALALAEAGIPFEVVPGVTAGIAAPAYFGVPVTHRGLSRSVSLITAHATDDDGARAPLDLAGLALRGTLIFYMGLASVPAAVAALRAHGRADTTPAALISCGTYAHQRIVRGTLADIEARASETPPLASPVLFALGDVLDLADTLAWFGRGDLAGLRVVMTNTPESGGGLSGLLHEAGAETLHFPLLAFTPPPAPLPALDYAAFDWVVFSSPNAAEQLFAGLQRLGRDARSLARARFCAIGKRTAHAVEQWRLLVDVQPTGYEPQTVIAAMEALAPLRGARVLVPRADTGRSALPAALRDAGAEVEELIAYQAESLPHSAPDTQCLNAFAPQLLTFTNSKAVRAFATQCWPHLDPALRESVRIAAIGPVTASALRDCGLPVHLEPAEHDAEHLFEAICAWHADQS